MSASQPDTDMRSTSTSTMRATATWFLDQPTLPRHQNVRLFDQDFHGFLDRLIPQIEDLVQSRAEGDASAKAALAGVAEARRRMDEPEAAGLRGEVDRVKRSARSLVALCDHFDVLTCAVRCPVCDAVIKDGDR